MNSGNAIFSKYPIVDAERISLPEITEQDAITKYFYLRRNILDSKIKIGSETIAVLNIHTAAYANDGTKEKQINIFTDKLLDYNKKGMKVIAGGDLNTIPPHSTKWENFPDSKCEGEEYQADDYSLEKEILQNLYANFSSAINLDSIANDESKYFTHTTNKDGFWNRKLDYIFTTKGMVIEGTGKVHQNDMINEGLSAMDVSDHSSITVKVRIK